MKIVKFFALIMILLTSNVEAGWNKLPDGFVFLTDIDPTIIENGRYHTDQNFLGRVVTGYEKASRIVCTKRAAEQLKKAHDAFKKQGYMIVVYDGYRPERAVADFREWGKDTKYDRAKEYYYPTFEKKDLFKLGYIAGEHSTHTKGSTFDLTLIKADKKLKPIVYSKRKLNNGEEISFLDDNTVDMGSSFDLFHPVSRPDSSSTLIDEKYVQMRKFLAGTMEQYGFKVHAEEWWHFTLENEPYPNTYFDFVVETE